MNEQETHDALDNLLKAAEKEQEALKNQTKEIREQRDFITKLFNGCFAIVFLLMLELAIWAFIKILKEIFV